MSPAIRTVRWLLVAGVVAPASFVLIWACTMTPKLEPFGSVGSYLLTPLYLSMFFVVPALTPPLLFAWWKRRGRSAAPAMVGVEVAGLLVLTWAGAYLIHELSKSHVSVMDDTKPAWLGLPFFAWLGHPMVATGAAAVMVVSFIWLWASRRAVDGECRKCGYDRRGLATHATCPECGMRPARR